MVESRNGFDASPVRIALVTDAWHPQVNGVVTTLNQVKTNLEAAAHELLVVNPSLFRTVPCPKYGEIQLAWWPPGRVRRLLDEFKPEAVHIVTEGPLGMLARRHCRKRRWPFSTSYHTQFPHYLKTYAGVPRRWTYRAMRWFHGGAERTLVPTPSVKRELDDKRFSNIVVWTRGVDTQVFRPRDKSFLNWPRPIFLYCGRVAEEKNIDAFLSCDLPGSKLIVGDGPAITRVRKQYPGAHFVGFKHGEELARHFAASDVFVFSSRTDTFGVVMLEAMASGLPVAAYPVTGPIDVVAQGRSGVLHDDLRAAALEALKLDPAECRRYAEGFSWKRCADMFFANLAPIRR